MSYPQTALKPSTSRVATRPSGAACACNTLNIFFFLIPSRPELLQRRVEVPEEWLQRTLQQLNAQIQFQMMLPDYLAREHEARRTQEAQQLSQLHPQVRCTVAGFKRKAADFLPSSIQLFEPKHGLSSPDDRYRKRQARCCLGRAARWSGARRGAKWAGGSDGRTQQQ